MLRFDFMASDFNPHLLILGDHAELAELASVLRGYAEGEEPVDLACRFPNPAATASLLLAPADEARQGVHHEEGTVFKWGLLGWQASVIADGIEKLNEDRSGSQVFELGAEGEIPLKVSHGEFTDDFLVTKR